MSNWIKLPSGRLLNLALIVDIEYFDTANPYARLGLPAAATVGYAPELEWTAASIDVHGDDARALMAHFDRREVVRDAPLAQPPAQAVPSPAQVAKTPRAPQSCHVCGKPKPRLYGLDLPDGTTVGICSECEGERLAEIARERQVAVDDTPF